MFKVYTNRSIELNRSKDVKEPREAMSKGLRSYDAGGGRILQGGADAVRAVRDEVQVRKTSKNDGKSVKTSENRPKIRLKLMNIGLKTYEN